MVTVKNCVIEGCRRPYRAKGYCRVHFKLWRRGKLAKSPRYKACGEEGCNKPMFRFGMCKAHFEAYIASRRREGPDVIAPAGEEQSKSS